MRPIWGGKKLLSIKGLNIFYGPTQVVYNVSFHVNEGELVALIGSNGAGKTSILRAITGLNKKCTGEINFLGKDIINVPGHLIARSGVGMCPENRQLFPQMTVEENIAMGAFSRKDVKNINDDIVMIYERFPILLDRKKQLAGTLSGGEQQMLAIARSLMSRPKILLLDEPSLGLSPIMVQHVGDIIKDISNSGTTVLLVEQNASLAFSLSQRVYVLEVGEVAISGNSSDVANNSEVRKAYLGV